LETHDPGDWVNPVKENSKYCLFIQTNYNLNTPPVYEDGGTTKSEKIKPI
jgi:hypothetical protein